MEDSIALARALQNPANDIMAALAAYEEARKPAAQKLIAAANASAAWYEDFAKHMRITPLEFAMRYITRSGRVDMERLRQTSPEFITAYKAHAQGSAVEKGHP